MQQAGSNLAAKIISKRLSVVDFTIFEPQKI